MDKFLNKKYVSINNIQYYADLFKLLLQKINSFCPYDNFFRNVNLNNISILIIL